MRAATLIALLIGQTVGNPPVAQIPIGAGAVNCGKWIESRRQNDPTAPVMVTSWVHGFLWGSFAPNAPSEIQNRALELTPDSDSLKAWLDKYCRENPLKDTFNASLDLRNELYLKATFEIVDKQQQKMRDEINERAKQR
jgi:hypothetical protein